ncbi:hypothetical protein [Pontibacter sp. G13]|uniref:hypothetical protein n=1 Tax=Pontibacter sp. G13 TaxID=3074898 RepID=UPI00288C0777|nr:hypothetical protein [Pontibacter sp. G13]WNJ19944.1 hypothetical protein RJD25_05625 [Pontibacter sp. G13]
MVQTMTFPNLPTQDLFEDTRLERQPILPETEIESLKLALLVRSQQSSDDQSLESAYERLGELLKRYHELAAEIQQFRSELLFG